MGIGKGSRKKSVCFFFNGSAIKALMAVGTLAVGKKGSFSLMARPLPLLNGTAMKKELFFVAFLNHIFIF